MPTNLYAILTLVLSISTLLAAIRVLQLQRYATAQRKVVQRLERTIEKLNARNGKLWYQIARAQNNHFERREQTGLTITKV